VRDGYHRGEFTRRSGKLIIGAEFDFFWKAELAIISFTLIIVIGAVVWSGTTLLGTGVRSLAGTTVPQVVSNSPRTIR
jgi:hypothetical protein